MTLRELSQQDLEELNNRFTYHPPKGDQALRYQALRDKAKEYATLAMQLCPPSRERATALTELVNVNMLLNASIAINEK